MFSDPGSNIGKATEDVSVSGDEFALLASMSASCTKAVDLQLENKLVGIERLNAAKAVSGEGFAGVCMNYSRRPFSINCIAIGFVVIRR